MIGEYVKIENSEFEKLIASQEGSLNLNSESSETGTIELYNFSGNNYPEILIFRKADGQIVSIGLDHGSSEYDNLKKKFE